MVRHGAARRCVAWRGVVWSRGAGRRVHLVIEGAAARGGLFLLIEGAAARGGLFLLADTKRFYVQIRLLSTPTTLQQPPRKRQFQLGHRASLAVLKMV
jgi:hypothetical protein